MMLPKKLLQLLEARMSLKQILSAGIISIPIYLGVSLQILAAPSTQLVANEFTKICFDHLPDFSGTKETLEVEGYILAPFGEGEFEFSHPSNGIWGAYAIGQGNGGCTVAHDDLSLEQAKQLAHDLMLNWLGGSEPELWTYEGVPSAYTTNFESNIFYLIFNEGGLSADIRTK